jgi:hypothetical protein
MFRYFDASRLLKEKNRDGCAEEANPEATNDLSQGVLA